MRKLLLILYMALPFVGKCQLPSPAKGEVGMVALRLMEGQEAMLIPTTTQTEVRPGWKIVDYQLNDRVTRYLWGAHATQLADAKPSFVVTPAVDETLYQYAIIPLKCKREYRKLPRLKVKENTYLRFTPDDFHIEAVGDSSFLCAPLSPLAPGDYFLLNIEQKPLGELGDYTGFPFRVME